MKTVQYLDAVKARFGLVSDYSVAKKLGFTQTAVSQYRHGRRFFDDDAALIVAQVLDLEPIVVIAAANAERAKTPEAKARWESLMEKFSAPVTSFRNLLSQWDGRTERRAQARFAVQ
jgi:transcriptional regulator with XRE-family HTH domain